MRSYLPESILYQKFSASKRTSKRLCWRWSRMVDASRSKGPTSFGNVARHESYVAKFVFCPTNEEISPLTTIPIFLIFRYLCQLQVHQHHFLCLFVLLFAFAHHLSFAYLSHWWGCESFSMWFYIGHFRQFFVYFGTFNDNTKFLHTNVKNVRLAFELIATKPVVISLCLSSNECFISVSWSSFYFFLLHLFWFCLCL